MLALMETKISRAARVLDRTGAAASGRPQGGEDWVNVILTIPLDFLGRDQLLVAAREETETGWYCKRFTEDGDKGRVGLYCFSRSKQG
jgi:hypothetical protein